VDGGWWMEKDRNLYFLLHPPSTTR